MKKTEFVRKWIAVLPTMNMWSEFESEFNTLLRETARDSFNRGVSDEARAGAMIIPPGMDEAFNNYWDEVISLNSDKK